MTREEMARAYADGFEDKDYREIAYNAFLCGYGARCEPSLPSNLDEAANNYGVDIRLGYPRVMDETDKYIYNAFKAGAEWMAEQDKKEIEHAFFLGYNECEDRMKKEFEKRAMTGTINNIGYPTTIKLNTFDSSLKNGEEVIVQVMKK